MLHKGIAISCLLLAGCIPSNQPAQTSGENKEKAAENCPIKNGDYPVQQVQYNNDTLEYNVMALGLPACAGMPMTLEELKLARIEEDSKEAAILNLSSEGPTLRMNPEFKIDLVQTVNDDQGQAVQESSSWSPFLSGMAGAAVGMMAANALSNAFRKPQHYMPPPVPRGGGQVNGYGSRGDTREMATKSYQRKFNKSPGSALAQKNANSGFFKKKTTAKPKSGNGFFKKKSRTASKPKRGFFKKRRR